MRNLMNDEEKTPEWLKTISEDSLSFKNSLKAYILQRLMLSPQEEETDLYRLCVLNLKRLAGETIVNSPQKYDCHQTNIAVKKKVLLIMHLEKLLHVHLNDDLASQIETLSQLADALKAAHEDQLRNCHAH